MSGAEGGPGKRAGHKASTAPRSDPYFAFVLSQQGVEAGGSLIRVVPGRVGAALTKSGRASTARWCGSGERGGKEYARNRRCNVLQPLDRLEPGGSGPGAVRTRRGGGGELLGWFLLAARKATGKDCGVPVAMPLGQSRAPPPPSETQ
jgi:hypothetical protein